jgi:hypothetical protein
LRIIKKSKKTGKLKVWLVIHTDERRRIAQEMVTCIMVECQVLFNGVQRGLKDTPVQKAAQANHEKKYRNLSISLA